MLFKPFSLIGSLLAGIVGRKAFARVWRVVDEQRVPDPEERQISWPKLIAALLLEGAILRIAKGVFDHGARVAFSKLTGRWPGEERPERV